MKHSTKAPTVAQKERLDALSRMRCIACELQDCEQPLPLEIHHIVDAGYRKHSGGHDATLPLDQWHHRGICKDGWTTSQMTAVFGPSLAVSKREFIRVYGGERCLLAIIDARLSGPARSTNPHRRILPTPAAGEGHPIEDAV